jgi:ParB family chromosome partitioning protein
MQKVIIENAVSERHARALLRIEDVSERDTMLSRIINEKLSVERTEALISIVTSREAVHFSKTESRAASVTRFLDNLKSSCELLASQGVDVVKSIRYSDNKLRIYITIDEE